jgi:hypothetical protein
MGRTKRRIFEGQEEDEDDLDDEEDLLILTPRKAAKKRKPQQRPKQEGDADEMDLGDEEDEDKDELAFAKVRGGGEDGNLFSFYFIFFL